MEKLNKEYEEYQNICITEKNIIESFIKTFIQFWEEDTLMFENFKEKVKVENIKELSIWSYIGLKEEINYQFKFNDDTTKFFYTPEDKFMIWLEENNLVEEHKEI